MELSRLSRAIASRWVTVAVVVLLSVLTALAFTVVANSNQEERWEAQASLRFEPVEGEGLADLADDLSEAEAIARIAADELLIDEPDEFWKRR